MNQWTRWTAYVAVVLGLGLGLVRPAFAASGPPYTVNKTNCGSYTVLTENLPLNFGSIAANGGGSVTVSPSGGVTSTGVILFAGTGAAPASYSLGDLLMKVQASTSITGSCADFISKSGFSGITVSVSGSVALTDTGGNNPMYVTNLTWALCPTYCSTVYNSAQQVPWDYTKDDLYVGGTLTVGSTQPGGSYSTTNAGGVPITITLTWN